MLVDRTPIRAPATPESIGRLRRVAAQAAQAAGATPDTVDHVRLAVSEAVTNAVLHAFPTGAEGEVGLDLEVREGDLVVSVQDDGWGLRPRDDSPGMGLGLPLIARLAHHSDVETAPGAGTTLRMRFRLDTPLHV